MQTVANNLVSFYLGMYNTGKVSLTLLISTGVSKDIFLSTYKSFINDGTMQPIESLPEDEKNRLVNECRETGLNFTNLSLTDAARILHTLKFINANT